MKYTTLRTTSQLVFITIIIVVICLLFPVGIANAAPLRAGVAKVNITYWESGGIVKDSAYVRALVLDNGSTRAVIISADVKNANLFLDKVRTQLKKELNIDPVKRND